MTRYLVTSHSSLATKRGAFTLIELLVVISIIALLMGLLLSVLPRARRQAQEVACRATLRQWGIGFSAYTGDHDGKMPLATSASLRGPNPNLGIPPVSNEPATTPEEMYPWFLGAKVYAPNYEGMLL